jgi:hypothetical protein
MMYDPTSGIAVIVTVTPKSVPTTQVLRHVTSCLPPSSVQVVTTRPEPPPAKLK